MIRPFLRNPAHAWALLPVTVAPDGGNARVEIYLNGELVRVILPDSAPEDIEDVRGKVTLTVPDRDSHVVIISIDSVSGYHPEQENRVRMPLVKVHVTMIPLDNGRIEVVFQGYGDPGGSFSSRFFRWFWGQGVGHRRHRGGSGR